MAYCRFGDSDLYIYRTGWDGPFVCQLCLLVMGETLEAVPKGSLDYQCSTREELVQHVQAHEQAGHKAPYEDVYWRLRLELGE